MIYLFCDLHIKSYFKILSFYFSIKILIKNVRELNIFLCVLIESMLLTYVNYTVLNVFLFKKYNYKQVFQYLIII